MIDKSKEFSYMGIPTFFKAEYGDLERLSGAAVGVFGVPTDIAASNRQGSRLGPSSIRAASTFYNPSNYFKKEKAIDLYRNQEPINISVPEIIDLGDVTIYPTDFSKTLESIEEFSYEVSKRAFPLILGGDHSITYPVVKGIKRGFQANNQGGEIGILHFDSHPDIWESYVTLDNYWHGSPFRNLLDEGIIKGGNIVTIGDRSLLSETEFDYMNRNGIQLFSISDIWQKGMENIMRSAVAYINNRVDGIYVSIDIDVFDPCYAPGTGTPVPGGISPREMIQAIGIICESCKLVGIDMVEVAPQYDPTENTQNLAAFILHRFLISYKGF